MLEDIKNEIKGYALFGLFGLALVGLGGYIYVTGLIDDAREQVKKRRSEG